MEKSNTVGKVIKWSIIGICSILIIGLLTACILWRNQIATLYSLKQTKVKISNFPFYTMNYKGDYGFDDYLKVGSKSNKQYWNFISKKLTHWPGILKVSKPNCASFTATTPNGDRLFARNLDTDITVVPLLLKTKPSNGYKSMSMVNMTELGKYNHNDKLPLPISLKSANLLAAPYFPVDGMNKYGVAMSVLVAFNSQSSIKKDKTTLNDFSIMRMVLDKAKNVNDAVKLVKKHNLQYCFPDYPTHFMIADATGASVVIEYINGELQTVYGKKPYNIVTNYILYKNPAAGFGLDRYVGIEEKLKETKGILTEKQAMALLSRNIIPGSCRWSIVYNLTRKTAYICLDQNYDTVYKYKLN